MRVTLRTAQSALPEVKAGDVIAEVQLRGVDATAFCALIHANVVTFDDSEVAEAKPKAAAAKAGGDKR